MKNIKSSKGQVVVEYVLLLTIAVAIAFTLITTMVSRAEGNLGFLILKWDQLIETIAADCPDHSGPGCGEDF